MGKLEKLMFSIGVRDEASGPVGKLQKVLNSTQKQAGAAFGKIGGGALAVAGAGLAVETLVSPALEMNRALAEVSSLDVDTKGLRILDATAKRYAMSYGGTAKEFVDASYAIQSGIAGLTGEELSSFTYASAVMAKATKADASTMTAYTGTMYGIFQKQAEAQGKAAWIEDMAGKTAHAIKVFKTSGYEMSSAFTSLGANATSAGISLDEQMAILGKLQATMSGSEAGTKYKAFLMGVGNAQKELGMKFVDSQGKMLPVLQILEKLKKKYGALDKVVDSDLIKKAFGSDEAVGMLKPRIQDTAGLAKNIDDLGKIKGMETATNMARKMVDPFMKLEAGINTVSVAWWQKLLPPLNDVVDVFNVFMGKILWAIEEFPNIARWIGYAALAVTVFAGVMGLASIASGLMKLGVLGIISPFGKLCGVLKWFLEIMSLVKAAILANPLLFIVYGAALAVAGIAWLVSNWEEFKASYGDTWWGQAIIAVVQDICAWWERLTSAFSNGEWGKFLLEAINLVTAPLRTLMEGIGWVLEKMGLIKSDSAYYKLTKPLEASTFTGEEGATASPQYQAQAEKALVGYELYGMGVPSPVPSVPAQSAPQALQRQSEVIGRPAQQNVMQAQGQVARFERAGVREAYRPQLINAVSAPTQPRMPSLEIPRIPAPQSRSIYNTLNNSNTNRSQNKTMTIGAQYFNFEGLVTRERVEEMMAMSFD